MASAQPLTTAPAKTIKVEVEMTPEEFIMFSKNQITFEVHNQTPFLLKPNPTTFADWGDFSSGPSPIDPFKNGDGGHVMSSHSLFTGSAGMVGYSIEGPDKTVYIRLLASNPYLSARDNWAYVSISSSDDPIDQSHYNTLYSAETKSASNTVGGKTLKIVASMGQADDAQAKFSFSYQ